MNIKAILIDFDGTVVTKDILDVENYADLVIKNNLSKAIDILSSLQV